MVNVTAKDNQSGGTSRWLQLPVWDEEGRVTRGVMWPPPSIPSFQSAPVAFLIGRA